MATVTYLREGSVHQTALFSFTSDGSAQAVNLGFKPSLVKIINETDAIEWEWVANMAATKSIKRLSNATTQIVVDTTSQIVYADGVLTLGATLVGTAKAIKGIAIA